MSNVIGVINLGKVEQMGNSEEIYEHPSTKFVAGFIGEANILGGTVEDTQDGQAVVKHQGVRIVVQSNEAEVGESVFVSIRPEKIRVGLEADRCKNVFEGRVTDEVYVGLASRVQIELNEGPKITANVQIADIGQKFELGSRVKVGWEPANCIVVRR